MEPIINEEKTKEMLREILADMIKNKKDVFYEIISEALEETCLANAIKEGRKNQFVHEDTIMRLIEDKQ